jgi:translation initiation factor IF-3
VPTKDGKDENIGVVPFREALNMAADKGMDLVEVAPNANPPVCRIMDFSKFLYERSKKEREARKAQKVIEVKEIQLQLKTSDYHTGFKINNARKWLADGMKVKVRIQFHGREIDYRDLARDQMESVIQKLQDLAFVESSPKMDGRAMIMVLAPLSMAKEIQKEKELERQERQARMANDPSRAPRPPQPQDNRDRK